MIAPEFLADETLATSDTPLLHAARIKIQSLLTLADDHSGENGVEKYPSLPVVQDYNQILALARKALPELKLAFPPDIITPYHQEYQKIKLARMSFWEQFLPSWHATPKEAAPEEAKLIPYREFFTLCRQIERLLK